MSIRCIAASTICPSRLVRLTLRRKSAAFMLAEFICRGIQMVNVH
jgi:hypothetical protein